MTIKEIKSTPELVDFMLDESVIADSREKLRKRLEKVCNLAIKALEQESCENCISRADVEQTVENNILCYTHSDRWMDQDPDTDCHKAIRMALKMLRKDLEKLPPVTPRSLNPEADREESKAYCAECDHIEMCSWYPHDGCEWLKTGRYNTGYNAAKREIALSGEYERAYERGKADAQPKTGRWIPKTKNWWECSECGQMIYSETESDKLKFHAFCGKCGAKMINVPDKNDGKMSEIPTGLESEDKEEMNEQMVFPETFEKFAKEYGFKDDKEVYTNGSELIPIFRVKQWLEHDNKLRAIETDTAYECGKHANKWIPASERLPAESVPVLVQAEEIYYADSYTKGIIIGWRGKMGWHTITNKGREAIHYPIAWMPLPEPYEPQKSEES